MLLLDNCRTTRTWERHFASQENLRLNIISKAGTGKSKTINIILDHAAQHFNYKNIHQRFAVLSFTGSAASQYERFGSTIYSFFKLTKLEANENWERKVYSRAKPELKEKARALVILVLEEISFIHLELYAFIDRRLRFLRNDKTSFGGIPYVISIGDALQMLPVGNKSIFTNPDELTDKPFSCDAAKLFRSFKFEQLFENCRVTHDLEFDELLTALRKREIQPHHVNLLNSRVDSTVSREERQRFSLAPRIFATNDLVSGYNLFSLLQAQKPILKIVPIVKPFNQYVADKFTLHLSDNVDVVLLENLSVSNRLFNGTECKFYKPIFRANISPKSMPACLLLHVPQYRGASIKIGELSLLPSSSSEFVKELNATFIVKQFKLALRAASSCHKAQERTLKQGVICLGSRDIFFNQTYVMLSRFSSTNDFLLTNPVSLERLTTKLHFNNTYKDFCVQQIQMGL